MPVNSRIDRSSRRTPGSAKFTQFATCHDAPASSNSRLVTGFVHVPWTTPDGHQSQPRSDSIAFEATAESSRPSR